VDGRVKTRASEKSRAREILSTRCSASVTPVSSPSHTHTAPLPPTCSPAYSPDLLALSLHIHTRQNKMLRDLVPKIRSPTDRRSAAALGSPPIARQPQNHWLRDMFDSARMYVFVCVRAYPFIFITHFLSVLQPLSFLFT
jgi:hypothetical protein